jgi:hypothetical protein
MKLPTLLLTLLATSANAAWDNVYITPPASTSQTANVYISEYQTRDSRGSVGLTLINQSGDYTTTFNERDGLTVMQRLGDFTTITPASASQPMTICTSISCFQ